VVREMGQSSETSLTLAQYGANIKSDPNHPNVPDYREDDAPIDAKTIWKKKGSSAQAPRTRDVAWR